MQERRKYPREGCLISGHVRAGARIYECTLVDICEDGCFAVTPAPFDSESMIQVRFRHPRSNELVKARAVVARRIRPGEGRMGLGLRLVDTLGSLEPASGAQSSSSGTWSRPELATRSGTWSRYDLGQGVASLTGEHEIASDIERRGKRTDDTSRTDAGRVRVQLQIGGGGRAMALLINMSEGGFCAASEHPPPEGKLMRLETRYRNQLIAVTSKVVWRSDTAAGLRTFGARILQFGDSGSKESWAHMLASLRR